MLSEFETNWKPTRDAFPAEKTGKKGPERCFMFGPNNIVVT